MTKIRHRALTLAQGKGKKDPIERRVRDFKRDPRKANDYTVFHRHS